MPTRPRIEIDVDALRTARSNAGLTQEALAAAVGVTPGAIGLIETRRRQPGADLLARIGVALAVHPDELLADLELEDGAA